MPELNADDLKYISEFQRVTNIYPSDCIGTDFAFIFLVENKGELFKCIGKNRSVLNKLVELFRKPVFIFVKSSDLETQIKNLFHNLSQINVKINDKDGKKQVILIVKESERGYAVGKGGNKIKAIKVLLNQRFDVKDFQLRTTKQFVEEN